jgi:hypothetical protein
VLAVQKASDQFSPTSVHAITVEPILVRSGGSINDIKAPALRLNDPSLFAVIISHPAFDDLRATSVIGFHQVSRSRGLSVSRFNAVAPVKRKREPDSSNAVHAPAYA